MSMGIQQYTYWSVTINNPDENDMVLVRNPNDKYVRQFIYTLEEGAEGTPHVQGWCRLHRNQTLTFMKRLYPRANLKPITKDDYNENSHDYAQKNDETTRGKHVISTTETLQTIETIMVIVINKMIDEQNEHPYEPIDLEIGRLEVQKDMVRLDYRNAKFFVSAVYKSMWREYGHEMYQNIFRKREEENDEYQNNLSNKQNAKSDRRETSGLCEGEDESSGRGSESYEESEGETDEGSTEGSSYEVDEEYDQ